MKSKKFEIMKPNFKKTKLILLLFLSIISCAPPPPPMSACDSTNTPFQQLYLSLTERSDFKNLVSFDTEIHEYTFIMDTSGEICSFGYQSRPTTVGLPYTIELLDASDKVIFSQAFSFSPANTYYAFINPITIIRGQPYTLRRIILLKNVENKLDNLSGRTAIKNGSLVPFPIKVGNMTITSSNFYQNGTPLPNAGIPFIDFTFN